MNVHIQKLKVVQTCSYSKCNVKLLKLEWFRWLVWHAASNVVNIPRVCQKPSLQSPGPHRVQAESFVRPSILISSSSYFTKLYRFVDLLSRLERKPGCKGHSLEMFLTYPMHQVIYCRILITFNWFTNPGVSDPSLHHHAARAAGPHAPRPRGEEVTGERAWEARGSQQADARRGVGDRKHKKESLHREDDPWGLRHTSWRQPSFRASGHLNPGLRQQNKLFSTLNIYTHFKMCASDSAR